jgi:hypothetical protein
MTFPDSTSLKFWEVVARCGFGMVVIGAAGEGAKITVRSCFKTSFKKREHAWDVFSGICWLILVAGLAVEFKSLHNVSRFSDSENVRLNKKVTDDNLLVAQLIQSNMKLEGRIEELRSTNLWLRATLPDK